MPFGIGFWANGAVTPAATGSYVLLETTVLTGSQASVEFTNLTSKYASTYQHLQIRYTARGSFSGNAIYQTIQLNGDTAGNYSWHLLRGNGSSVASFAGSNTSFMQEADIPAANSGANIFGAVVLDLLDPFETTKNKTIRSLTGFHGADVQVQLTSGNWRNTASVTSIKIAPASGNLVTGSRFSLYGLRAA